MHVLIADERMLMLSALRLALRSLDDPITVIECMDFEKAVQETLARDDLDLAVLNLGLAGILGVESIRAFRARCPEIPVAVMSGEYTKKDIFKAFEIGVVGFLPMTIRVESLGAALRLIASGQSYLPLDVLTPVRGGSQVSEERSRPGTGWRCGSRAHLTDREMEVLSCLIEGQPNKRIARSLAIEEVTVKLHLKKIFRKLGASNRTHAVRLAIQDGLVSTGHR